MEKGKPVALCTIVGKMGSSPRNEGAKMLVDSDGNTYDTVGGGGMERRLVEEALKALAEGKPQTITFALGVEPKEGAIPIESRCGGEYCQRNCYAEAHCRNCIKVDWRACNQAVHVG